MTTKGKRVHYSQEEKRLLISLVDNYKNIIENKKTNAVNNKQKDAAWEVIAKKFNSRSGVMRDVESLRKQWSNIKQDTKKKASKERAELYKTGGGPNEAEPASSHVLSIIIGRTVYGMEAEFDSDKVEVLEENNEDVDLPLSTVVNPLEINVTENLVTPNYSAAEAVSSQMSDTENIPPETPTKKNLDKSGDELRNPMSWTARRRPKISDKMNAVDQAKLKVLQEQATTENRRREQQEELFQLDLAKRKQQEELDLAKKNGARSAGTTKEKFDFRCFH